MIKLNTARPRVLSSLLRSKLASAKGAILGLPGIVDWYLRVEAGQSCQQMLAFKEKHLGERCFIIGNGPSLRKTDLSLLKNEVTFGLNRIYLLFDEMDFATSYYVAVNKLVLQQCSHEIAECPCPKFIAWHSRNLIKVTPFVMFFRSDTHYLALPQRILLSSPYFL